MEQDLTLKTDDDMTVITITDIRGELSGKVVRQLEQMQQQVKGLEVTKV